MLLVHLRLRGAARMAIVGFGVGFDEVRRRASGIIGQWCLARAGWGAERDPMRLQLMVIMKLWDTTEASTDEKQRTKELCERTILVTCQPVSPLGSSTNALTLPSAESRANTTATSANGALPIHRLWPSSRQRPPGSCVAVVASEPASDPTWRAYACAPFVTWLSRFMSENHPNVRWLGWRDAGSFCFHPPQAL